MVAFSYICLFHRSYRSFIVAFVKEIYQDISFNDVIILLDNGFTVLI